MAVTRLRFGAVAVCYFRILVTRPFHVVQVIVLPVEHLVSIGPVERRVEIEVFVAGRDCKPVSEFRMRRTDHTFVRIVHDAVVIDVFEIQVSRAKRICRSG
ncbi:hypothetical protein D3C87_1690050 [compost metagenome]